MEKIIAIGRYTLIIDRENDDIEPALFYVNLNNGLKAEVVINYKKKSIETKIVNIDVSSGFIENIKQFDRYQLDAVPDKFKKEISSITKYIYDSTTNVISLIKYYLRHVAISEILFSVKGCKWGRNTEKLYDLPTSISASISYIPFESFDENNINNIQLALDKQIEPLLAMRHLHRAKAESLPHHKWIDATIAAELAVKEVLAKAEPKLEFLLMEIPSPPLTKLYGSILEQYLGEKSPYLSKIREGVEVRNKLIHKPSSEKIDYQKANDYVDTIESAIFDLLSKVYPNEPLISNAYRKTNLTA